MFKETLLHWGPAHFPRFNIKCPYNLWNLESDALMAPETINFIFNYLFSHAGLSNSKQGGSPAGPLNLNEMRTWFSAPQLFNAVRGLGLRVSFYWWVVW